MAGHESFDREDDTGPGSHLGFGLVFATALFLLGLWQFWHDGKWTLPLLGMAGFFAALAWLRPHWLAPFNRLWYRFGLLLHLLVSPVAMALLFFGTILPTGWLMRLCGKRPLDLHFNSNLDSYWIERQPPGPAGDSFRNQF